MLLLEAKPELPVYIQPAQSQIFPYQVSSGPRSPGDWARPPAPVLWDDGPAPAALIRVPATPRWLPGSFHSQFYREEEKE